MIKRYYLFKFRGLINLMKVQSQISFLSNPNVIFVICSDALNLN